MQYLCKKQLVVGGITYYPGNIVPEGVILPDRSLKLVRNNYISEINKECGETSVSGQEGFTQEQVDHMIDNAVLEAVAKIEGKVSIQVAIKRESGEGDHIVVLVTQMEIQQVFSIMQMNVEEAVKEIAEIKNENMLILLHAIDNRKMIKEASKKQVDNLYSENRSDNSNTIITHTEGVDT